MSSEEDDDFQPPTPFPMNDNDDDDEPPMAGVVMVEFDEEVDSPISEPQANPELVTV